jgi:oxygen-dependent protoporphyrinogen oxidase
MGETTQPFDVAVLGGGITGLATAFWAQRGSARTVLLEGGPRVGGSLRTLRRDGWTFELGANTVLDKPSVSELLRAAQLEDGRQPPASIAGRRWVWARGALRQMPSGPASFLGSRLLPMGAKLAVLREPFVSRRVAADEESLADFVRRRLGAGWLENAVGPFVSGVYAGDPERLSVRWAVPRIAALEADHGSLVRGALAKRKGPNPDGGSGLLGYRGGFSELTARLAARLRDLRTDTEAIRLRPNPDGFLIETTDGTVAARQVVVALPARATGELLASASDGASLALAAMPHAPVVVASLGYRRRQVAHRLDGFGFLAARGHGLRALGCLFTSSLFPDRAPEGQVALTVFAGGRNDESLAACPEDYLLEVIGRDLKRALGVQGEPTFRHLQRWRQAIPQYELGHGRYVALAEALEERFPGLHLAGNWRDGVSVPDSLARAAAVADRVLATTLGQRSRQPACCEPALAAV